MAKIKLPYLSEKIAGVGGKIKVQHSDFRVFEIPAYSCNGQGEHLFLYIEKDGITTFDVVQQLAKQLHLPISSIGYAGTKDCHAITCQYFSVPFTAKPLLEQIHLYQAKIQSVEQHSNKLRIGHLKGNRFEILIREPLPLWQEQIQKIADVLQSRGVPNYYGPQRFGIQNNTDELGKAILEQIPQNILYILLAKRYANDSEFFQVIKDRVAEQNYREAYQFLPSNMITEKYVLKLIANGMAPEQAVMRIPKKMRNFYISAYQSELFNRTLAARIQTLDQLWLFDLAMKHPSQAVFLVKDLATEQERCARQEISPTGPIFGYKMLQPEGQQGQIEQQILSDEKLKLEQFKPFHYKGERRSYRFFTQITWREVPEGISLSLTLPKGCYATVVLDEIMKSDWINPGLWEDDDADEDED